MLTLRPAKDRGHANHGWLDSRHTFSFADYYDPQHMGFRGLRVINEDRVAPGQGFGRHPHRDMEIVTYVLAGALEHKDSLGTGSVIQPGDVQRMSAGTGVFHSEYNASTETPVHFLQIWLLPNARGLAPSYQQKSFSDADKRARLCPVASPGGEAGSVQLHADVRLYAGAFEVGEVAELALAKGRGAWVQVARGEMQVNGQALAAGDGLAAVDEDTLLLQGVRAAEVLVFDLA
jgi:quercetin 2,3-dioxygenase